MERNSSPKPEPSAHVPDRSEMEPRFARFLEWCDEQGVIMTSAAWPAFFGSENLRGVVCTKDIKPYEAIMYVPHKLLITTQMTKDHPILGQIVLDHPSIFKTSGDWEYNLLILFLIHERCKGKESFWHPYLDTIQKIDTPIEWDQEHLDFIEDTQLRAEIDECNFFFLPKKANLS